MRRIWSNKQKNRYALAWPNLDKHSTVSEANSKQLLLEGLQDIRKCDQYGWWTQKRNRQVKDRNHNRWAVHNYCKKEKSWKYSALIIGSTASGSLLMAARAVSLLVEGERSNKYCTVLRTSTVWGVRGSGGNCDENRAEVAISSAVLADTLGIFGSFVFGFRARFRRSLGCSSLNWRNEAWACNYNPIWNHAICYTFDME